MAEAREPRWVKTDMQKYQNLLEKVRYLRTKGWVTFMKDNGRFVVGTKETDEDGLIAIWSREKAREPEHKALGPIRQEREA